MKVPIALLGAEIDTIFPQERLKKTEELLSAKAKVRETMEELFVDYLNEISFQNLRLQVMYAMTVRKHCEVVPWC